MLEFIVEGAPPTKLKFEVKKFLNMGRTARDPRQIQKHLDELKKAGIASALTGIPLYFPKLPDRITSDDTIQVLPDSKTCGEVEYVILIDKDDMYVTVGSDHSDRELEKQSISYAKHICRNVIAPKVWHYEDVKKDWDDIVLRAWVEKGVKRKLYQEGKLASMLKPEEIVEKVKKHVAGDLQGMVIFAGTPPILDGELCFHSYFEMEIADELNGRKIQWAYATKPIDWFKE
ncbi:DUF2848 family protein [Thermodesulfobacteriota bacterium]